jgi:hypothetical protein
VQSGLQALLLNHNTKTEKITKINKKYPFLMYKEINIFYVLYKSSILCFKCEGKKCDNNISHEIFCYKIYQHYYLCSKKKCTKINKVVGVCNH